MTSYNKKKAYFKEKIVIIINGRGGVGKDTLCEIAARYFKVNTISAITPIKEIASNYGWKGEKDKKSRRFLSDLKRTFILYNNLPNEYLECEYESFLKSDNDILFVHIRENDQIEDFKKRVYTKCVTLLIRSSINASSIEKYGNYSDDFVENYEYDYCYVNDKHLDILDSDFMNFLNSLLIKERVILSENT